jgi:hypothetical protein
MDTNTISNNCSGNSTGLSGGFSGTAGGGSGSGPSAPEIDPGSAGSALTLLLGALLVLRGGLRMPPSRKLAYLSFLSRRPR